MKQMSFLSCLALIIVIGPLLMNPPNIIVTAENTDVAAQNKVIAGPFNFGVIINGDGEYPESFITLVNQSFAALNVTFPATSYNFTVFVPTTVLAFKGEFQDVLFDMASSGNYTAIFIIGKHFSYVYDDRYEVEGNRTHQLFRQFYPNIQLIFIDTYNPYRNYAWEAKTSIIDFNHKQGAFIAGVLVAMGNNYAKYGILTNYNAKSAPKDRFTYEEDYIGAWIAGLRYIQPSAQIEILSVSRGSEATTNITETAITKMEAFNSLGIKIVCNLVSEAIVGIYASANQYGMKIVGTEGNESANSVVILSVMKNTPLIINDLVTLINSTELQTMTNSNVLKALYGIQEGILVADYLKYMQNTPKLDNSASQTQITNIINGVANGTIPIVQTISYPNAPSFTVEVFLFGISFLVMFKLRRRQK